MANKKIWLGMLALALAFGMTVGGCKEELEDPVVKVENGTTFQVKSVLIEKEGSYNYDTAELDMIPVKSDPAGISPGAKKSYKIAAPNYASPDNFADTFFVRVTLIVTLSAISEATITSERLQLQGGSHTRTSSYSAWNADLLLSGTNYNSLKLNKR